MGWINRQIAVAERLNPWTNVYGLARSLIALGTLLTLVLSSTETLFHPVRLLDNPRCIGPAATLSLFCTLPIEVVRLAGIGVLLLVVIGWRPRWTAIPHWWISFSVQASISLPEGGDQAAAILAMLFIPVALTDRRKWHWSAPDRKSRPVASFVSNLALLLARVQVMVIYLQAFIAKLFVPEWVDGTAVWYWLLDPNFGPTGLRRELALWIGSSALGMTLFTWGTLVIEAGLAYGLLASPRARRVLLVTGVAFHGLIALTMGLMSFSIIMWGALLIYLWPRAEQESLTLPHSDVAKEEELAFSRTS